MSTYTEREITRIIKRQALQIKIALLIRKTKELLERAKDK